MTPRVIHATLDLLDRQIVDRDDESVGKVDDVELTNPATAPPRLVALLLGPQAYGQRLGGRVGRWIASTGARLAGTNAPIRIPIEAVEEIGVSIRLKVSVDDVERVERLEHWLSEHLIERIPGAGSASE